MRIPKLTGTVLLSLLLSLATAQLDNSERADSASIYFEQPALPSKGFISRKLLASKAERQGKALLQAVGDADQSKIKQLLEKGADIDYQTDKGVSAMTLAAYYDAVDILELLMKEGATVDIADSTEGYTPLLTAAFYDNQKSAKLLLKAGADPDWKNEFGETALFFCVSRELTSMAEILLKNGASVNITSDTDNLKKVTLLYHAARNKKIEFVKLFLEKGASVDAKVGKFKYQALRGAAFANSAETIQLLLDNGADIDHQDTHGWTALFAAAYFGNEAAVRALVQNGADTELENSGGSKPLDSLCSCAKSDDPASLCRTKSCKDPSAMEDLLS